MQKVTKKQRLTVLCQEKAGNLLLDTAEEGK